MSTASPEDQPAESKTAEEDDGGEAAEERSEDKDKQHLDKLVRVSWAFQVLEANREGDVDKLKQAFRIGKGALIDTRTAKGGYGGFRYSAWGKAFGGQPDGETILHLVVRPDNSQYPNRWEMASALLELEPDFTARNAAGKTPRDLNKNLCDALLPVSQWRNKHVLAWLESAGRALRCKAQWVTLFEMKEIVGFKLLELANQDAFDKWLVSQLSDLTKLGVASEVLDRETYILKKILREVAQDEDAGLKFKAKQERRIRKAAKAKADAEARAKVEAEAKAAAKANAEAEAKEVNEAAEAAAGLGNGEDWEEGGWQAGGPKLPPVVSAAASAGEQAAATEHEATDATAAKLPVLAPSQTES